MKNAFFILCVLFCSATLAHAQTADTFRVFFPLNGAALSKTANKYLDSLVARHRLKPAQKYTVLGYADYLGSNGYNDSLSGKRAKNVADALVKAGLNKENLQQCTGKGKIERAPVNGKKGVASDRQVLIITGWIVPEKSADTLHINVATIEVNAVYPLDILFENCRSTVLPESYGEMEKVYRFLKNNPSVSVAVEGHICCLDPHERATDGMDFNDGGRLSLNRAKVIYKFLIAKGIDPSRLRYGGLGNTKPFRNPEVTEDDRKMNRRVSIRILQK